MDKELVDATEKVLKTILGRTWTDLIFRPSLVLVAIASYLIFATYYIHQVHTFTLPSSDPDTLIGDTFILLIGSLVIVLIVLILIMGNNAHEKHEMALRRDIIDYLKIRREKEDRDISSTLDELIKIDDSVKEDPHQKKEKYNLLFILLIVSIFIVLSLIPDLGIYQEIFMILNYIMTIGIVMIAIPSISTFIVKHEKGTVRFCDKLCDLSDELQLGIVPLDLKEVRIPLNRYRSYTVISLGLFGIYWLTRVFAIRNRHYMEQWYFEDCLFISLENYVLYKY